MQQQGQNGVSTNTINFKADTGSSPIPSATDIYAFTVLQKLSTLQKWFMGMVLCFLIMSFLFIFCIAKIQYSYNELERTAIMLKYNLEASNKLLDKVRAP